MTWVLLALFLAPEPPVELLTASRLVTTPVAEERTITYDVEGAIRLGLFWLSRHGVGRATWRFGKTQTGCPSIELAAGSDPATAPLKINRWGMMKEVRDPRTGKTASFGMMRISRAASAKMARDEASRDGSQKSTRYDLLRGLRDRQEFMSTAGALHHPSDFGLWEKDSIAGAMSKALEGALPVKRGAVENDRCHAEARTVLFTLSDAVHKALDKPAPPAPKCYIHDGREFDLVLEKVSHAAHRIYGKVFVAGFSIVLRNTGAKNRLEPTAAETVELRGLPVELKYQPNYWFRLRFTMRQPEPAPAQR